MSLQQWIMVGRRLSRVSSASAWALGDWLLFGERTFEKRYRAAIEATELDYKTLRNYAWVARGFSVSRRRDTLSFKHHAEVVALSEVEQELWLARAEAQHWSRNELRERLRPHRASAPAPRPRSPVVVRVEVTPDDRRRWSRAAARTRLPLHDWLRVVADAAADAQLDGHDNAEGSRMRREAEGTAAAEPERRIAPSQSRRRPLTSTRRLQESWLGVRTLGAP
jgi:hypothetical protein